MTCNLLNLAKIHTQNRFTRKVGLKGDQIYYRPVFSSTLSSHLALKTQDLIKQVNKCKKIGLQGKTDSKFTKTLVLREVLNFHQSNISNFDLRKH